MSNSDFVRALYRMRNDLTMDLIGMLDLQLRRTDSGSLIDLDSESWGIFMRSIRFAGIRIDELQAHFDLADTVGGTTTARWMNGEAKPNPETQTRIVRWARDYLRRLR